MGSEIALRCPSVLETQWTLLAIYGCWTRRLSGRNNCRQLASTRSISMAVSQVLNELIFIIEVLKAVVTFEEAVDAMLGEFVLGPELSSGECDE
jgi:hypothetical protein